MSESNELRLDTLANARLLLGQLGDSLAQVLESMTDQRPGVDWKAITGTMSEVCSAAGAGPEPDILWWEQPFQLSPDAIVWVGAPRATWEYTGTLTLKVAGLETVEAGEAKNTWFEILGQALSTIARAIGSMLGREVTCEAGVERVPNSPLREWAAISLKFSEQDLPPLVVALSSRLVEWIASPQNEPEAEPEEVPARPAHEESPPEHHRTNSRTMELLLDVDLPVSISFGKAQLPMKDVLKLTTGSIVELNRGVSEQVEVLVNQCLIARGEVVVIDGNYGVRIQEIASRQDRIRTFR